MGKIISIDEASKMYDANAFFNIFKIAFFVQIKSIEDCVVDLHGFKYQKFGLIFGDDEEGDFVSLEKEPKFILTIQECLMEYIILTMNQVFM